LGTYSGRRRGCLATGDGRHLVLRPLPRPLHPRWPGVRRAGAAAIAWCNPPAPFAACGRWTAAIAGGRRRHQGAPREPTGGRRTGAAMAAASTPFRW